MKMVTEPPRSNKQRSATPAAGSPRRAAQGAQPKPGARKRNPAVKPTTPKQGKATQGQAARHATRPNLRTGQQPGALQGSATSQQARAAQSASAQGTPARSKSDHRGRAGQPTKPKALPKRQSLPRAKGTGAAQRQGGLKRALGVLRPAALMDWVKRQVGNPRHPNWRGVATIALTVIAVVMLLYGGIIQTRKVSQAQQLEGFQARVITAVVVSHGFGGTQVDVNGENVSVAQLDEPVPVGQPLRVRINPNNPGYVVDARIDPTDAIATAKRNRLFTVLLALITGAGAAYLVIAGRGKR